MIKPIPSQTLTEVRESGNSTVPTPPPPAYQDTIENDIVGETYYQPPPPPPPTQYIPPPPAMGTRMAEFYSPPNRRLAMKRRVSSFFCVFCLLIITIGLAVGLTRNSYDICECRSDADCAGLYGTVFYCYNTCECVAKV